MTREPPVRGTLLTIIVSDQGSPNYRHGLQYWFDGNGPVNERLHDTDYKTLPPGFVTRLRDPNPSIATSRLVDHSEVSGHNSLPALSSSGSDVPSESIIASGSYLERQPWILEPDGSVPAEQPALLECPLYFLGCRRACLLNQEKEWIDHSLTHFRSYQASHQAGSPPQENTCPFCSTGFKSADGVASWRACMEHVAQEHHSRGETLSTARPVFSLIRHLWQIGSIPVEELRELWGRDVTVTPEDVSNQSSAASTSAMDDTSSTVSGQSTERNCTVHLEERRSRPRGSRLR